MRSKKAFLKDNSLNFPNTKIQFMSCNVFKDIIDVFLLYNNKKVNSNSNSPNYYRIVAKDIGVKSEPQQLSFIIVNCYWAYYRARRGEWC